MDDFPNLYGRDGYPQWLSMENIRQPQWAFGHRLSNIDGHTAPGHFTPFPRCENTYPPWRQQYHRSPRESARFQTFFEHPSGRLRPSARSSRLDPQGDRPARYPRPHMRPEAQENINREPNRRTRNLPIRPIRRHFEPMDFPPQAQSSRQAAAVGGEAFTAERTIPLGSTNLNSTRARSDPPIETWAYKLYMQSHDVLTPQGYPAGGLFDNVGPYNSTESAQEPLRNRSPTHGHCSTIADDESERLPKARDEPNGKDRYGQEPENAETWENSDASSAYSSPPEPWTPFPTSYSEQQPEAEDYFTYGQKPNSEPLPRCTQTFNEGIQYSIPQWSRHRRRLPRPSFRRVTSQLRHLQRTDRQLRRERNHLLYEQALLQEQKEALRAEKRALRAEWRQLRKAQHAARDPWGRPKEDPYPNTSDDESIDNRSVRTPPGTPSPSESFSRPSSPSRDPSAAFEPRRNNTTPSASAALENYNQAWTSHAASPTSTPIPWPTASLLPYPLTVPPRPLPDALQPCHRNQNPNTSDVITHNTQAFFARAFNLRPRYADTGDVRTERRSGGFQLAGLEEADAELMGRMRAQVKRDVLRWHEDKRGRPGGVEEAWTRAVYAGVFAFREAIEGEVKRRGGERKHSQW